jgi:hypothetical protein
MRKRKAERHEERKAKRDPHAFYHHPDNTSIQARV